MNAHVLDLCKQDLKSYSTSELLVLSKYYGISSENLDDLCWALSINIVGKKHANFPSGESPAQNMLLEIAEKLDLQCLEAGCKVNEQFLPILDNPDFWQKWIQSYNTDLETALCTAAENGYFFAIRGLLGAGADVHTDDECPLRKAVENGHVEVVNTLYGAGADVKAEDNEALRFAAKNGHLELVDWLLVAGADLHAEDDYALRKASKNGHTEVVKTLLHNKADIHARGDSALRGASQRGYTEIVELLLKAGSNVHADDDDALVSACEAGELPVVKLLVEGGANVNARSDMGLRIASRNGHASVVKFLLDAGATTVVPKSKPYSDALLLAALYKHNAVVKILLESGKFTQEQKDRSMHYGNAETTKLFLKAGANVRYNDNSPLISAAWKGESDKIKLLLKAGANAHARNDQALKGAAQQGHVEAVKVLLKAGGPFSNIQDILDAANTHYKIIKLLLNAWDTIGKNTAMNFNSALQRAASATTEEDRKKRIKFFLRFRAQYPNTEADVADYLDVR